MRWNVPSRPIVGIKVSERAQFGALVQLTAKPGSRDELVRVLGNYARTLDDGEPGTTLYTAAADPHDAALVWTWEEFADVEAGQAHCRHDSFRALQLGLEGLLAHPPAIRPLPPVVRQHS